MSSAGLKIITGVARQLDAFSEWTGRLVAWLVIAMVLLISYDVAMRYLFQRGSVALQEMEWHLFAVLFLLGSGYTLKHDDHVRVDILYQSRWMTPRRRAWVNLLGSVLFLAPFCVLVIVSSWPFLYDAYLFGEASPDPGGLPMRWILKAMIPVGFWFLLLQGVAIFLHSLATLLDDRTA